MPRKAGRAVFGSKKRGEKAKAKQQPSPDKCAAEEQENDSSQQQNVPLLLDEAGIFPADTQAQPFSSSEPALDADTKFTNLAKLSARMTADKAAELLSIYDELDRETLNTAEDADYIYFDAEDEQHFNLENFVEEAEIVETPGEEAKEATIEKKMRMCPTSLDGQCRDAGYEVIHTSFLLQLLSAVICPCCHHPDLSLSRPFSQGLAAKMSVFCPHCEDTIFSGYTSPMSGSRRDVNKRLVLGAKDSGISHPRLHSLFAVMDLPPPLNKSTFDEISQEVHDAARTAAEKCLKQAAADIKEKYEDGTYKSINKKETSHNVPVSSVSYGGTWQTRGYSSNLGVGVAIDIHSDLVFDTEVLSNYCQGCLHSPPEDTKEWEDWHKIHKPKCQNNHDGTSKAMEAAAAVAIFARSITLRMLLYGVMLAD